LQLLSYIVIKERERDPDFAVLILKIYYKKGSRYCGSNPIFLLMKRKGLIKRKGIQIFQLLSYIDINEKGKGFRYCSSNPIFLLYKGKGIQILQL